MIRIILGITLLFISVAPAIKNTELTKAIIILKSNNKINSIPVIPFCAPTCTPHKYRNNTIIQKISKR